METTRKARTTKVDGFTYSTTAPVRRISGACAHYVGQHQDALAGLTQPVLEMTLDAAFKAAAERDAEVTQ